MFPTIGVLGGMGPAATADFYAKLIAATPAARDQDHLPVLIHALPQIPDRAASYLLGAPSPAPMLAQVARRLQRAGARLIVMPCNTAHLWFDEVQAAMPLPMLHIVDAVLDALDASLPGHAPLAVGLLATEATVRGELYPRRSRARSSRELRWLAPTAQQAQVSQGIAAVKQARRVEGRALLADAAAALVAQGAQALVYACTEIPLVLDAHSAGVPTFDATQLLAEATVRWALRQRMPCPPETVPAR